MLRDPANLTLPLKVVNLVAGRYTVEWNQVMAATLLATVPVAVVFATLQRYLVQGLTLGAVK
jgi:multiple sugar transport system permease protein